MPSTVAICMPAFNREDLVADTLDSVLAQNYPHWELRVVDDGSTDRTKDIIAEYAARDPRIILTDRTAQPKGACTCRNEGVMATSAKYVMFLDTDDIIEPFCLENRVRVMDTDPELEFGIFPSLMFKDIPGDLGLWWNIDKPETDELLRQFRHDSIAQGTGILFRRDAFIRIGMWNTDLQIWQDVELFFRAYIQRYKYRKFFELPPDLHNRTGHMSLSRKDLFTPDKQSSKETVIRSTVVLLRNNGMKELVHEMRFLTAEVVTGASRSGNWRQAVNLLHWARAEGILGNKETIALFLYITAHYTKAIRVKFAENEIKRLCNSLSCISTVGKIDYQKEEF